MARKELTYATFRRSVVFLMAVLAVITLIIFFLCYRWAYFKTVNEKTVENESSPVITLPIEPVLVPYPSIMGPFGDNPLGINLPNIGEPPGIKAFNERIESVLPKLFEPELFRKLKTLRLTGIPTIEPLELEGTEPEK